MTFNKHIIFTLLLSLGSAASAMEVTAQQGCFAACFAPLIVLFSSRASKRESMREMDKVIQPWSDERKKSEAKIRDAKLAQIELEKKVAAIKKEAAERDANLAAKFKASQSSFTSYKTANSSSYNSFDYDTLKRRELEKMKLHRSQGREQEYTEYMHQQVGAHDYATSWEELSKITEAHKNQHILGKKNKGD